MFVGEQQISIRSSLEAVYKMAETYPDFVSAFSRKSKRLFQDENSVEVLIVANLLGIFPTSWKGFGKKTRNKSIKYLQTKGLFEGLTADWNFEVNGDSVIVKIITKFEKPSWGLFLEGLIGRNVVEKTTGKILIDLKKEAEALYAG